MKKMFMALLAAVFVFVSGYAFAGTQTANIASSVTVLSACTISAGGLAFPNYTSGGGTDSTMSTTVGVNCGTSVPYTITSNTGANSASYAPRQLYDGVTYLGYNLYTDAGYLNVFGDGTGGTLTIGGVGTGILQNYTVWAKIPFGQVVPGGAYSDTVITTVTW